MHNNSMQLHIDLEQDQTNGTLVCSDYSSGFELYLGDRQLSMDFNALQNMRVSHIINATKKSPNFFPHAFEYMRVPIGDEGSEQLLCWFKSTAAFIEKAKREGAAVLVHCECGMSRSVAIVLAYLMKGEDYRLVDALELLQDRRPQISPNSSFMAQLVSYEQSLFEDASLRLDLYFEDRFRAASTMSVSYPDSSDNSIESTDFDHKSIDGDCDGSDCSSLSDEEDWCPAAGWGGRRSSSKSHGFFR